MLLEEKGAIYETDSGASSKPWDLRSSPKSGGDMSAADKYLINEHKGNISTLRTKLREVSRENVALKSENEVSTYVFA